MEDDVEMAAAAAEEDGAAVELDDMKKRLKEMEDEATALREMQAKVEQEMGAVQGCSFFPIQSLGYIVLILVLGILMFFSSDVYA